MHSREAVRRIAKETNFRPEHVEKVLWLMDLLNALAKHPALQGKIALKGGTALNLFCYPLPRLSVDIDLNYIGSADRSSMLAEKPLVEKSIGDVCTRLGLRLSRQPSEHAGGKWTMKYRSAITTGGNLEFDLNWLLRIPLWTPARADSCALGPSLCQGILVLDLHELAAGKLTALLTRSAPRDVFDSVRLLEDPRIDLEKLRIGLVIYGAMSRTDFRLVSPEGIVLDERHFRNEVLSLLRSETEQPALLESCRAHASRLLPLRPHELEFLRLINEEGVIEPDVLGVDEPLAAIIREHPALQWKAHNVRQHRGA